MYPLMSSPGLALAARTFDPLLIVGPPRTGSSFLVDALVRFGGFSASAEGHLFALAAGLDSLVRGYYADAAAKGLLAIPENTIAKVPEAKVRQRIAHLFVQLQAELTPKGARMLDKTVNVEAIGALPYLLGLWPAAKVLYLQRDGIENVESAQKFFGVDLQTSCRNWTFCGEEWDRVRPLLPPESVLVLDHAQLTRTPAETCRRLASHLGLSDAVADTLTRFVTARVESWLARRPDRPTLAALDWEPERMATFLEICALQMVRQGYATRAEVSAAQVKSRRRRVLLTFEQARVLRIDDPAYFVRTGGGWFVVSGRSNPTMITFDRIPVAGARRLVGELMLMHPCAQPVRVEIIGLTTAAGQVAVSGSVDLLPRKSVTLSLPIDTDATYVDLIFRVAIGARSRTNDHTWVRMAGMALDPGGEPASLPRPLPATSAAAWSSNASGAIAQQAMPDSA